MLRLCPQLTDCALPARELRLWCVRFVHTLLFVLIRTYTQCCSFRPHRVVRFVHTVLFVSYTQCSDYRYSTKLISSTLCSYNQRHTSTSKFPMGYTLILFNLHCKFRQHPVAALDPRPRDQLVSVFTNALLCSRSNPKICVRMNHQLYFPPS